MLTDLAKKIKVWLKENQRDLYLAALVFVVSVASFGLGRLSAIWPEKQPIAIEGPENEGQMTKATTASEARQSSLSSFGLSPSTQGDFVASRNGSSYHLPDCPGAKQIKEENKIWFQSAEAARSAGYKPAGNCPGL